MTSSWGIDQRYVDAMRDVFRGFAEIENVWLYGSRSRGDWRPDSDIDIAIEASLFPFTDLLDLKARLDDLPLIFKIDVVHIDELEDQRLKESIRRDGQLLYKRQTTK